LCGPPLFLTGMGRVLVALSALCGKGGQGGGRGYGVAC
jgi:hypothetical protein